MEEDTYGSLTQALCATDEEVRESGTKGSYIVRIERIHEDPDLAADGIETFRCVSVEQFNAIIDAVHEICKKNPSFWELP